MNAPELERGPLGRSPARLGRAAGVRGLWPTLAVLVALAMTAPQTSVAASSTTSPQAFQLDAAFWSLARGGATAPALLGPPTRTPRRAPSVDLPAETPTEPTSEPPAEPVPSATPPGSVPSTSQPIPGGTGPTIPAPTAIPQPTPGTFADSDEPTEADDAPHRTTAADVERSLSRESGPPPTAAPQVVEEGPQRLILGKSVPPFWIDRTWTTHRTRALTLPPLFVHRTGSKTHPEKLFHFDLSLTTGWYNQKKQKRRYFSPLALFFGSFSERTSAWAAGVLLMGYKRTGEQFNFGQFPFVWRWGNKQVKNLVVVPFHYHQKTPDSLRGFDAILFWYGHKNTTDNDPQNDLRYFIGAPIFIRVQRGVGRLTLGLPVYAGWRNKAKGVEHHTVFPLAHWGTREFGNRRSVWTLLYIQRRDEARKTQAWAVPPLVIFNTRTPDRSLTAITPLIWRGENHVRGTTAWAAFPWVSYRDPAQINRVLFPLFWQFKDRTTGASTTMILPLAGLTRRPGRGFTLGIAPLLAFARSDPKGRNFQVVTPLFWRFRDRTAYNGEGSHQIVVPPLFVFNQQGKRRDVAVLPALSFFGRDATRRYQVIAPLLFGHVLETDKKKWHDTWAFGPFYVKRTIPGWHSGLLPLLAMGRDDTLRYTVIPPLLFGDITYVKEQRRLTVSPLFARSKAPDHRTIGVLNLFWDVKRAGNERHTVLFPLFVRRQFADRVLTITPLGGGLQTKDRSTWMATPLIYGSRDKTGPVDKRRRSFGLIPLVFSDHRPVDGGMAHNVVVAPLFARHRAPSEDLDMWSPLVWRTATRGEKPRRNLAVFPFYFRQRQPGGIDVDAGILPPFFASRDPVRHTHTTIAGPFFHRLSRKQLNTGIVPLYWWHDSLERRRLISLPLIVHIADKSKLEHTTIALPLWFDRRKANGRRTWVALPFVIGTKGQFNFTRFSLIPPGFVDAFRLGKNFRFTGFVPLLFRYQKCGFREEDDDRCRYTLWGSFPLFFAGRDGHGRRTHSALGLYYFDRDKGGTKFLTLLGGASVRPNERLTWYALQTGRTVTRTHTITVSFPFFFQKNHRTEDRGATVVLPPLFIERRKEEFKWFEAGLLVWNFRRPHKATTVVGPLIFYSAHSYAERRTTWLLPLFIRDNRWAKDSSFTIVPPGLVFQRRRGKDSDWVQFPLLWHIERGTESGTVGVPLWWDIRRKNTITQVVPALFTRHVRKTGRATNVVGPGLGWWTRQHGDKPALHWRALFGAFGGGNEGGDRYMSLFGAKIKLRPKPVWITRRQAAAAAAIKATPPAPTPVAAPTRPAPPSPTMIPLKPASSTPAPERAMPAVGSQPSPAPVTETSPEAPPEATAPAAPGMNFGASGLGTTSTPAPVPAPKP